MMSIGRVRSTSSLKYYERGDVGEEPAETKWLGQGAEALKVPEGEPWGAAVKRILAETRAQEFFGWDLTFSAPKSVSVVWAAARGERREQMEQAVWGAVRYAVRFLEENCYLSRSGHAGASRDKAGLVVGAVMHTANRSGEPFLHVHGVAANAAYQDSGEFKALYSRDLYRAKMACGALFRCELARLLKDLGFSLRAGRHGNFEIEGVSDEVIRRFSSRSAEVQHAVSGRPWAESAKGREVAALATREEKRAIQRPELEAKWATDLQVLGQGEAERLRGLSEGLQQVRSSESPLQHLQFPKLYRLVAACWHSREQLVKHLGHFSRFDLIRTVANALEVSGLGAEAALVGVKKSIEHGWLVKLGEVRGQTRWTTAPVLEEEAKLLRRAERLSGTVGTSIRAEDVEAFRRAEACSHLNHEQHQALSTLASGPDLQLLRGVAGSGKTMLLKALAALWEAHGYRPLFCAPTHKAVQEIEAATGGRGATAASLLWGRGADLGPKSIVVVDEAAMLGTQDLLQLLKKVVVAGAKVVLVGDENQLQPVERGGGFLALWRRYGGAELVELQRQRGWFREVVRSVVAGDMDVALRLLKKHDRLLEFLDERQAVRAAASLWMEHRTERLSDILAIAGSRRQVEELNEAIREARIAAGELDPMRSVSNGEGRFSVGDRALVLSTARDRGYRSGEVGTVERIAADAVFLRMDRQAARDAELVRVPLWDADEKPCLALGYAVTTYKAQGATAEKVVALAQSEQDSHAAYVQLSRARSEAWVVLSHQQGERLSDVALGMERKRLKELATEAPRLREDRVRDCDYDHCL